MNHLIFTALALSLTSILLADTTPSPVSVTIKTKPAQMKYDLQRINADTGAKVTITLQNDDDLPHNLVVCKPKGGVENDKGLEVAMAAWNLGEAGMKQEWIPQNPRILAHTKMVNPHQSETITFTAPNVAGIYPYVCTFPGHAMVMNGRLRVSQALPPVRNLHYRYYIGDNLTKLPDFGKLTPVEEGQVSSGKMDITLHQKERHDNYAYEFEGMLDCPKEAEYTFNMGSDDGSQLWIDGKDIIKIDDIHPTVFQEKTIKLTKGEHSFKVHYFQGGGNAEIYLSWSSPDSAEHWLTVAESSLDAPQTGKESFEGIPLVVTNEARIYRNFIEGSSPRGIAVGYPGNVNICWDADQMNLALVWQGAFMDAKRHWTDRGVGNQPPLGFGVAKLGQQHALGVLTSQTDPWVPANKKDQPHDPHYIFRGYELDTQRKPTFHYDYKDVAVTETFIPDGQFQNQTAAIKRSVKLRTSKSINNLYFLALAGTVEAKDSAFIFDKTVKVTTNGIPPVARKSAGHDEVLLPIVFKDGTAEFTITYSWNLN